jgi:lysylphosphatidylglycerol synthetase-like protein (DUF2156 family)
MEYLLGTVSKVTCANFPPACLTDFSKIGALLLPLIYIGAALYLLGLFLYAGMIYVQSEGDPARIKTAQHTLTYGMLGIFVIIVAYFIVRLVSYILNIPFIL